MPEDIDRSASENCTVCGTASHPGSFLCPRCRRIYRRNDTRRTEDGAGRKPDIDARVLAMQKQWRPHLDAFECHYTEVALNEEAGTTRFATWEHLTPGDEGSVVLVADLVNRMKADMTDAEFRRMTKALARKFGGGDFDASVFPDRRRRLGLSSQLAAPASLPPTDASE
jgi:predicted RNA-binding Zn-ribbon protein involved in translation (DUF1610 family)